MAGKICDGNRRTCFEVLFLYGTFPTVYNDSTRFRQLDLLKSSGANPSGRLRTKNCFQSVDPKSDSRQSVIQFHKYDLSLTTEQGRVDFIPKTPDGIPHIHISTLSFRRIQSVHFTIVWPCVVTDSLWIKPTDALNSNFIDIITLHVSGSLSAHHQEFLAVHRLWYTLCSCDRLLPGVGWNSYSW